VHDEQELATASTRRLPAEALAGLRDAFAQEVAERLPRLRSAVDSDDEARLAEALRDAHSLGSSAAVVGASDASRTARAAEALLLERPAGAPVPPELRVRLDELQDHLAGWQA
jgi:HPt (histidine-containing phosphotransfer) domain-containing protein